MMNFETSISLGDVITVGGMLIGLVKIYGKFRVIDFQVNTIWEWYNKRYPDFPPPMGNRSITQYTHRDKHPE